MDRFQITRMVPARRDDDAGVALVAVISTMAMVTMFLMVALYAVISNAKPARSSEDARTAYAAAQAGIDEYLGRLNVTSGTYWTKGNKDSTNPALTATGPGQQVQGAGANGARFRYQVLNASDVLRSGKILLQVTGISGPGQTGVGGVKKTLTATLAPAGFSQYVYMSDIEVIDPALRGPRVRVEVDGNAGPGPAGQYYSMDASEICSKHYYEGREGFTLSPTSPAVGVWDTNTQQWSSPLGSITSGEVTNSSCATLWWTHNAVVDGPFRSNDTMHIANSVEFKSTVETAWPFCKDNPTARCWFGSGEPVPPNLPKYAPPLGLPVSNSSLKTISQDNVLKAGCYYTGATRVKIVGNKMEVYSPNTTSAPSRCLNVANRAQTQTVALPSVIFVDEVAGACVNAGYPVPGEDDSSIGTTDYTCNRGTIMVQGKVDGQLTIASADDIVVTGDVTYAGGRQGDDILGLIAANYVWLWHPLDVHRKSLYSQDAPEVPKKLEAVILALRHSYLMQNWSRGEPFDAHFEIFGSVTQKFNGPVGSFAGQTLFTGQIHDYRYDNRLQVLQPPYFLQPEDSPWQLRSVTDG